MSQCQNNSSNNTSPRSRGLTHMLPLCAPPNHRVALSLVRKQNGATKSAILSSKQTNNRIDNRINEDDRINDHNRIDARIGNEADTHPGESTACPRRAWRLPLDNMTRLSTRKNDPLAAVEKVLSQPVQIVAVDSTTATTACVWL